MRTDEQIIEETNDLARFILAELIGNTGYQVPDGHKFYEAEDPRSKKAWENAVKIMEMTTKTEMADVLQSLEPNDEPTTYGVRFWATFRACAEIEIEADSHEDLIAKVKAYDLTDLDFTRNNEDFSRDGDETASLYGPVSAYDSPWGTDCGEVDLRSPGDPFSWAACNIVKELAKIDITSTKASSIAAQLDALRLLVDKAKAACTKEA